MEKNYIVCLVCVIPFIANSLSNYNVLYIAAGQSGVLQRTLTEVMDGKTPTGKVGD